MNALDRFDLSDVTFACAVYAEVFPREDFHDIHVAGVLTAVAALGEKEQCVLEKRLRQDLTLEAIGADLGLSRERIRQIEANAMRKLRIPKNTAAMRVSFFGRRVVEMQAQVEALTEENAAFAGQGKALRHAVLAALDGAVNTDNPRPAIPIEQLSLGIRAYNCLWRAGYRTTEDVLALDRKTLLRIRNLGRGTFDDIVTQMRLEGFTEWAEGVLT